MRTEIDRNFIAMEVVEKMESRGVDSLLKVIENSLSYFNENSKCQRLSSELKNLKTNIGNCHEKIKEISNFVSEFDCNVNTPANGYRSFIDIFESAIKKVSTICKRINKDRASYFFRDDSYAKYKVH